MAKCRSCGNELGAPFLSLGTSPLSNSYLSENDLHRMEPHYPLETYVCENCYLVQLLEFELAQNIFSADYAYYSSYSTSWLEHCERYTDMIIQRFDLNEGSRVLEVASNDGYLLQFFKKRGIPILGVEPAEGAANIAIAKGIPTDITFFNTDYANRKAEREELADLIVGNNVLAHNPNLNDFVEALRINLHKDGVITMEFPHLLKLLQLNQFDTIYHEHYSYFSFHSVLRLFDSHSLEIFDVEQLPTHGGSLRIYVQHALDGPNERTANVPRLLEEERSAGLLDMATYQNFGEKVMATKRRLLEFLIKAKDEGKVVVGYGAPAKGNTLLNYCGIRTDFIPYTVDRSPHKQGRFLPGSQIPIRSPERIVEDRPDYILILPWNLKEEIMEQMKEVRQWGGRFVIPIPSLQVL
jgi:SAM-dependent methyltransferase